ncbi:MAG: hypothetical protein HQL76_06640 [Magnetococcales bacterium]|nr:hypothetical protein [Magnetococcales bacterium]
MNARTLIILSLSLSLFVVSPALSAEPSHRDTYVQGVIAILRQHAAHIRMLATIDFKYSHNLVRHVSALEDSFGLLGPMDWHAARAVSLQENDGNHPLMDTEAFESLARDCQKSIKTLHQSAIHRIEGGTAEPVLEALDKVQSKCNHCHGLLGGAAPDVWGNGVPDQPVVP